MIEFNPLFLPTASTGILTYGRATACKHCGDTTPSHEMLTPSGRSYVAYYPSDTCCRDRALEVFRTNHAYAVKCRTQGGWTNVEEANSLDARNREITKIMRAKGLS